MKRSEIGGERFEFMLFWQGLENDDFRNTLVGGCRNSIDCKAI